MKALPLQHLKVNEGCGFATKISDPTGSDYIIISDEYYPIMVVGKGWMRGYRSFTKMWEHLGMGSKEIKIIGFVK